MKKVIIGLISLMTATGCMTRSSVMTHETFDAITLGTKASDLEQCAGRPFKTYCAPGGKEELVYIERIKLGQNVVIENHYVVVLLDGRVISKRFTQERPPAYSIIYRDDPTRRL